MIIIMKTGWVQWKSGFAFEEERHRRIARITVLSQLMSN